MSAFDDCKKVEESSLRLLSPIFQRRAHNGQFVVTSKGPLAPFLQRSVGDVLFNSNDNTIHGAELKAEQKNTYGNFFLETHSNLSRNKLGWMHTLRTDLLFYHFLDDDDCWVIPFNELREWCFSDGRIYEWPHKKQSKHVQMNDTWGRCVPISVVCRELGLKPPFKPRQWCQRNIEGFHE